MQVEGAKIIYADHYVRLCKRLHVEMPTYVQEMSCELSLHGSAEQHRHELRMLNNDGSWTVHSKK